MNEENIISVDIFEELICKNIDLFKQNMKNLDGEFIKPKTFTEWMKLFNSWI